MPALNIPSAQVRNDIEAIVETHSLSGIERDKLIRVVTGAVSGNRDRPLYVLAKTIQTHVAAGATETSLFDLLEPATEARKRPLPRFWLALLDFLAVPRQHPWHRIEVVI